MMAPRLSQDHGVTLVELMVAILIATFVVAAAFAVLTTSSKAMRANDQTVDTQQNTRIAMDLLASDIKAAGAGMSGQQVGGCVTTIAGIPTPYAIIPGDQTPTGKDSGPDTISLVVPVGNSTWTLASATGTKGFSAITLSGGGGKALTDAGLDPTAASTAMISINGDVTAVVKSVSGDMLTLSNTVAPPVTFSVGAPVFLLQCIRYQIGTPAQCSSNGPCLLRGPVAPTGIPTLAPIVDGVEDLQLAYACDGCTGSGIPDAIIDDQNGSNTFDQADFLTNTTWSTGVGTPDKIRLVQVSVVGRQMNSDQGLGEINSPGVLAGAPIQVSDHNAQDDPGFSQATYQQYRRRFLTKTLDARNVGL